MTDKSITYYRCKHCKRVFYFSKGARGIVFVSREEEVALILAGWRIDPRFRRCLLHCPGLDPESCPTSENT